NAFNRRTIKGFFKFLKQKISSVKSVDYLRSPTYFKRMKNYEVVEYE
ncbi:MAG: hypothetical protein ACJAVF_003797, partial [Paraglaciecola sp.]